VCTPGNLIFNFLIIYLFPTCLFFSQFYPRQDIKFLKNNNEVVTDLPDLDGTLQNIVIEPDIEIQTLSDDFQMDDGEEIM